MSGKHSRDQNLNSDSRAILRTLVTFGIIWAFSATFLLGYMIA